MRAEPTFLDCLVADGGILGLLPNGSHAADFSWQIIGWATTTWSVSLGAGAILWVFVRATSPWTPWFDFSDKMTRGALGIETNTSQAKKSAWPSLPPKEHGILRVSSFRTMDDYIQSLRSKSARKTMKGICQRIDQDFDVSFVRPPTTTTKNTAAAMPLSTTTTTDSNQHEHPSHHDELQPQWLVLGWEHYWVIVNHEQRFMGRWKGWLVGTMRFQAARLMKGNVEEYRDKHTGTLVAWTSTVVKGQTLRGMWFYQTAVVAKRQIWFHSVHRAIERALRLGLSHVDVGPSNKNVAMQENKARFGFHSTLQWNAAAANATDEKETNDHVNGNDSEDADDTTLLACDYSGPFVDIAAALASN